MSFAGTPSSSDFMPYRDNHKIHTKNLQGPARIILAANRKWVACIGVGRASLACAAELAKWGYAARIFDPNELPGVHPTYRIRRLRVSLSRVVRLRIPPKSLNVNLQVNRIPLPNALAYPSIHLSPLIASDCSLEGTSHGNGKRKGIAAIFAARGPHRPACVSYRPWRRRRAGAAMFDSRRTMSFPKPVSSSGSLQGKGNFSQMSLLMASREAVVEASRCLFCFDKPCMLACPARIDVPGFIQQIRTGNLQGSAHIILEANILGESCAQLCPAKALCEGACVMHKTGEQPIQIARLQRYAVKDVLDRKIGVLHAGRPNGKWVACIGSGPASLACAAELAKWGYAVSIFDRNELPGGNPTYNIPSYKISASNPLREVEQVRQLGVDFRLNTEVGRDISFAELEEQFDAIFIGIGLGDTSSLDLSGEDLRGVHGAKQFVRQTKMGRPHKANVGRRVAVIGAGNTAMGVLVALKRLGAETTHLIYRRGKEEMPAFKHEYEFAKEHGVIFHWEAQPVRILGKNGIVTGLQCVRTRPGKPDSRGRREPQLIPNSEFTLDVDMVIGAVGQKPATEFLRAVPGVQLRKDGTIITNEYQTGNEKYFAGGDCAHGAKLVVDAVASGKAAARSLDAWLGNPRGIPEEFGSPAAWTPLSAPPQAPEHPAS